MGETGKRYRNARNGDNEGSNQKRRPSFKSGKEDDGDEKELVVYRILCPNSLIGGVIGKGGKVINTLRQDTKSKIKLVDGFPGTDLRVFTIYCHVKDKDPDEIDEDGDEPLCPAQDGLLRVHEAILEAKANRGDSDENEKQECRILVPASQAANVIGKGGATIKRLRSRSGANIRVNPKDPSDPAHSFAMPYDNIVVISGDEDSIRKALYAISAIMYKFPPREEISTDTAVPELPPSIIIPHDVPIYPAGGFFPSMDPLVPSTIPHVGPAPNMAEFQGYSETVGSWPSYPSAVPVVPAAGGPSRSEELVVKVLCPSDKLGRVIGKGGSSIKAMRQASGAHIDMDDAKRGEECIITVTSTESSEDLKSAAVEAVLLLQGKINDEDEDRVTIQMLVPKHALGSLIGKGGVIINEIRKTTRADIRISKGERPKCASPADELVEVMGEVPHVRDALLQIVIKLREEALRDKDSHSSRNAPPTEPTYTSGYSVPPVMPSVPPVASLSYNHRMETGSDLGMYAGVSNYGYGSIQGGDNSYGSLSYGSKPFGGLPPFEMVIPANAVGKVLGKGGANLANIRKISGAAIEILDSKTSRSERIARISGTQEQLRTAENLIHAFIMST